MATAPVEDVTAYLHGAVGVELALNPYQWHLDPVFDEIRHQDPPRFPSRDAALAWAATHLETLRGLVRQTHNTGDHATPPRLCEAMEAVFALRKHCDVWVETHLIGLDSARISDNRCQQARLLTSLAAHQRYCGLFLNATDYYHQAHDLWVKDGHQLGQATALTGLGVAALGREQPDTAVDTLIRACDLFDKLDQPRGVALIQHHLGEVYCHTRYHDAAQAQFADAYAHFAGDGDDDMVLRTLIGIATTHHQAGDYDTAAHILTDQVVPLAHHLTSDYEAAHAYALLATIAEDRHAPEQAHTYLTQAHEHYTRVGAHDASTITRRLARHTP